MTVGFYLFVLIFICTAHKCSFVHKTKGIHMKQTLLVTALALMASSANATDFNQYISAKVARTRMQNDAFADFSLDLASSAIMRGTIADRTLKDNVWGARIAY